MKKIIVPLICLLIICFSFNIAITETDNSKNTVTLSATPSPLFSPNPTPIPTPIPTVEGLQYGVSGEKIKETQTLLSNLGYYSGNITGEFLDGTRAAIRAFQKDYGITQTGVLDSKTESTLKDAKFYVLHDGMDDPNVKILQERLTELGYFDHLITEKFRAVTKKAVENFQAQNGLTVNGIANIATQQLLFSAQALSKGKTRLPVSSNEHEIGNMIIAGDGNNLYSTYDVEFVGNIRYGSTGERVKAIQKRLTELGFFDSSISGQYLKKTQQSVTDFQAHNGLSADGVIGSETWKVLFSNTQALSIAFTPRPTPEPTPIPYHITIDVENQIVNVDGIDENGEYTIPVKKMTCSTGTDSHPSDVGDWKLTGRKARWAYFPQWGSSHAQFWTQINENIAFHSVTYSAVDYSKLTISSYKNLGRKASHGCVRLLVEDAMWIYDNIEKGVIVSIVEDLPHDEELRMSLKPPPLDKDTMGPSKTPEPTPTPVYNSKSTPPPYKQLSTRSEGEEVYWVQSKLKELGYYSGTITGGYYSGTVSAVKAFQKDQDMYPTGKIDKKTYEALYKDVLVKEVE